MHISFMRNWSTLFSGTVTNSWFSFKWSFPFQDHWWGVCRTPLLGNISFSNRKEWSRTHWSSSSCVCTFTWIWRSIQYPYNRPVIGYFHFFKPGHFRIQNEHRPARCWLDSPTSFTPTCMMIRRFWRFCAQCLLNVQDGTFKGRTGRLP